MVWLLWLSVSSLLSLYVLPWCFSGGRVVSSPAGLLTNGMTSRLDPRKEIAQRGAKSTVDARTPYLAQVIFAIRQVDFHWLMIVVSVTQVKICFRKHQRQKEVGDNKF